MRRILIWTLTLSVLLSVAACGSSGDGSTTAPTPVLTTENPTTESSTTEESAIGSATTESSTTEESAIGSASTERPAQEYPAECDHSWNAATCTAPKTCSKCGETDGNAAGHIWQEATCMAPKTCRGCGIVDGEKISHIYDGGKCKTCDRRQVGVGEWTSVQLTGDDLGVTTIDFDSNSVYWRGYSRIDTMDKAVLAELQQNGSKIVTYQGIDYINHAGDGAPCYSQGDHNTATVSFGDMPGSAVLSRVAPNQIKATEISGDPFFVRADMIFTYQLQLSVTNSSTTTLPATEPSITESTTENKVSQDENTAKALVGRWYLEGYADIFLDIEFNDYGDSYGPHVFVCAENFSFIDFGISSQENYHINECTIYPHRLAEQHPEGVSWNSGIMLRVENWEGDLSTYRITIESSFLVIDSYRFVRTKGYLTENTTGAPATLPAACNHSWNVATCAAPKTCSVCGATEGSPLMHDMSEATCTSVPTCKICGYADGDRLPHDFVFTSCTTSERCRRCGEENGVIIGHDFEDSMDGSCVRCRTPGPNYNFPTTVPAEPSVTEPLTTDPPTTEPASDVLIISDTQTISNQTINTDVYITSTGIATFNNVTVNGNIYCYGQLNCSGCTANGIYAYAYGSMMICEAFDGTHGKVSGGISCNNTTIHDNALDYAFSKWGKK